MRGLALHPKIKYSRPSGCSAGVFDWLCEDRIFRARIICSEPVSSVG